MRSIMCVYTYNMYIPIRMCVCDLCIYIYISIIALVYILNQTNKPKYHMCGEKIYPI